MPVLRYGADSSVSLEFAEGVVPVECGTPRERPLGDLAAAVAYALNDPVDYPPLSQSTTPGDRVVLALQPSLPQAAAVAAAVVRSLVAAGVDPDGISVMRTQADVGTGDCDPRRRLPEDLSERITLLTHDPADRKGLAYLAATKSGEAILLNRAIHEADLVLPIGCLHAATAAGYYGIHTAIFPTFSDQRTAERFSSPRALDAQGAYKRGLMDEVNEVAWLLGINFTIQLVPAGGSSLLKVVAGQSEAVARRSRQLYREAWNWPVGSQASLVVAAVEGDSSRQTWQALGRALDAAVSLVEDGGSIAVCCDLAELPGAAMQRMVGAPSRQAALRQIRRQCPPDSLPAAQLARALDRGKVYLLSRLDASTVETLDMIHVAAPDELARLARQHPSCILLSNAPYVQAGVEEEVPIEHRNS